MVNFYSCPDWFAFPVAQCLALPHFPTMLMVVFFLFSCSQDVSHVLGAAVLSLSTPQGESLESPKNNDNLLGQLLRATTSKSTNNQPTPLVEAKTVYGRHTTFGTVGDNDEKLRTTSNTSAGKFTTPDEDDSVRQPQRPRPPPEPPPPPPRKPKPGTGTNSYQDDDNNNDNTQRAN